MARDRPDRVKAWASPHRARLPLSRSPLRVRETNERNADMPSHTQSTVDIRGCRINLLRGGPSSPGKGGEPLLFLHGASGGGVWHPFLDRLAERFDVIAPDHPGYGRSDTPALLRALGDAASFYSDALFRLA